MKKLVIFLVLIMSLGFYAACDGGGGDSGGDECDGGSKITLEDLALPGGSYDFTPYQNRNFKFTITTAGNYDISISDIDVDVDWSLFEYVSNCLDDYDQFSDPAYKLVSDNDTADDEVQNDVALEVKSYVLRVTNQSSTVTDTVTISISL